MSNVTYEYIVNRIAECERIREGHIARAYQFRAEGNHDMADFALSRAMCYRLIVDELRGLLVVSMRETMRPKVEP